MQEVIIKDLYNSQENYENWTKKSKKGIEDISKINSNLLLKFLNDMFLGLNVGRSSKKGARSFIRLNALRVRLMFIIKQLESRGIKDINKTTPEQLHKLFSDMRTGVLKTNKGTAYKSTGDYIKIFKVFWHWLMRSNENLKDITYDLDVRGEKAKFVYFTKEDFDLLVKKAPFDIKPVLSLLFDCGCRVTELMNIKVSDFLNDFKELNIREETSKTFGRRIKLMLCSEQIKQYVKKLELKQNDFFVRMNNVVINRHLRELGKQVIPEKTKEKNLTLYDFRHSSACFWLPKYKSESALKYRFGWKKSDMIHYYTELLGMKDTITQDDLYDDVTKTELEKALAEQKALLFRFMFVQNSRTTEKKKQMLINKILEEARGQTTPKEFNQFFGR